MKKEANQSYSNIVNSFSIMGVASVVTLLLGVVRNKFTAVLIGTVGMGVLANFTAMQGMVATIFGLGVQSSSVREIAAANASGDEQAIARCAFALRRLCWITGFSGMLVTVAFSSIISKLTFGTEEYTLDIIGIGVVILIGNISTGHLALLQGMRRISEMAKTNVCSAFFATLTSFGFYACLGVNGIVPALIVIAFVQMTLSWFFARRLPIPKVQLSWKATCQEGAGIVQLGMMFMWTGVMVSAVSYATVALIGQKINIEAVGIYSAAFSLAGIFVNFILGSMGSDYYPTLTAIANDNVAVNKLVNEQTEVGLLVSMPGVLATMVLAPWIVEFFYTNEFYLAAELMQWFVFGCMGKIISWPLGYVMLAKRRGLTYALCETFWNVTHILLILFGISMIGIVGVAIAFAGLYIIVTLHALYISYGITGFVYTRRSAKLIAISIGAASIVLLCLKLKIAYSEIFGLLVTLLFCVYSLYGLVFRLGDSHRFSKIVMRIPFFRFVVNNSAR